MSSFKQHEIMLGQSKYVNDHSKTLQILGMQRQTYIFSLELTALLRYNKYSLCPDERTTFILRLLHLIRESKLRRRMGMNRTLKKRQQLTETKEILAFADIVSKFCFETGNNGRSRQCQCIQ